MDKETRNRIRSATQTARKLLEHEYAEQLDGVFDIRLNGGIMAEPGEHLDAAQRVLRRKLVTAVEHQRTSGMSEADAVASYLREAAFTTLNRFVALKMLEARELVQECVSQVDESVGFKEFTGLAPGLVQLPDRGYRVYIESLFDEIGREVRVLFDRRDPASLLWPRRQGLQDLLRIINAAELASVWDQDETIGWVYQYFNGDDERRRMRDESQSPRNSRELAVRNQFFTPRYVVQFLTDNTLGRIWYEMRQGDTRLGSIEYLVRRAHEVFAGSGDGTVDDVNDEDENLTQEDLLRLPLRIPPRPKKDPRDIRVLDPACGSGHFLLYAFDLLSTIYEEAWADQASPSCEVTGHTLRDDYPDLEDLRRSVPCLILEHNLFGIDIDPRCAQIAALALWMRAQRAYAAAGVPRDARSRIGKTNIVVAEPIPSGSALQEEFSATLSSELRELVLDVFGQLELAGEAGSLMPVERRIRDAVRKASGEHGQLFEALDEEQWTAFEAKMLKSLKDYANATSGAALYRRRLFASDAARGLGFIDLCRLRYDAVLMNPPFGARPRHCEDMLQAAYPETVGDLFSMFFERAVQLLAPGGKVGVISNRTWLSLPAFKALRTKILGERAVVDVGADLGSFVLEAQVETAAVVLGRDTSPRVPSPWIRLLKTREKRAVLSQAIEFLRNGRRHGSVYLAPHTRFTELPAAVFGYWVSPRLASTYRADRSVGERAATFKSGTVTADNFRFLRLMWEVPAGSVGISKPWVPFAKGGAYSPFYDDVHLVIAWNRDGREVGAFSRSNINNAQYYGGVGVTWPARTTSPFGPRLLPSGCAFGNKGPVAVPHEGVSPFALLGILASRPIRLLLSVRLGAGDDAPGSASKSYEVGLVRDLPFPDISDELGAVDSLAAEATELTMAAVTSADETASWFHQPKVLSVWCSTDDGGSFRNAVETVVRSRDSGFVRLARIANELDRLIGRGFHFSEDDWLVLHEELEPALESFGSARVDEELFKLAYLTKEPIPGDRLPGGLDAEEDVRVQTRRKKQSARLRGEEAICRLFHISPSTYSDIRNRLNLIRQEDIEESAKQIVSFCLGAAFGRFAQASEASPATPVDPPRPAGGTIGKPLLVDDPGHDLDIVRQLEIASTDIRAVGELLDSVRAVLCPNDSSIRGWLRSGFFKDHVRRYSKSKRKAPVYWRVSTASGEYSVWFYYHALVKDSLYRVVNDLVAPKLLREERRLSSLIDVAGDSPTQDQREEQESQSRLVDELRALRSELGRVAPLWSPNLNDGVIINSAPLWRLMAHDRAWQKECKSTWDKLCNGDYDWAHLAMHLWPERVVPKCAEDRSLAIAHGLEYAFWCEDPDGKWQPRKVDRSYMGKLVNERTSAAVKDALKSLLEVPVPATGRATGKNAPRAKGTRKRTAWSRPKVGTNGASSSGRSSAAVHGELLGKVKEAIGSKGDGAGKDDVIGATGISASEWNKAIKALLADGSVKQTGERRGARYHLRGGDA